MEPFETNTDLLSAIEAHGHDYRTLGRAPGGKPLVAVRGGGDREPGIVLTAGSHAGEHAGVRAAVELLERLDTDRRLDVFPTRDPVGLDGYAAALGTALGEQPAVSSFADVADVLRSEGEVVDRRDDVTVALVGDTGFLVREPSELPATSHAVGEEHLERLALEDPEALAPLRGRRVYLPSGLPDVEGTGILGRAHTEIVSPDGSVRHLNRFHDRDWAPVEPRCLRRLLAETDPGLFVDLHESVSNGERFHVTLRRTGDPATERRAERIGRAGARTVGDAGGTLATWEAKFGDTPVGDHHYTPVEDGVFWLEHADRNRRSAERERPLYQPPGLNSSDFVAEEHGLGFGMDTGMYAPFEERVGQAVAAVQAMVEEYEASV
jgi:hypothetical protein